MTRSLSLVLLAGCVPDLSLLHEWDDGIVDTSGDTGDDGPEVVTHPVPEGFQTFVDATDGLGWVRVDLDGGGVAVDDTSWEMGFQRFDVSSNSGVSGPGGVEARFFEDLPLDQLTEVPPDGWRTDLPDGDDPNDKPDWAFASWFDYDGATHFVSPNPGAWAVRTTDGAVIALRFDRYYDEAGNSAKIAFTWRVLAPAAVE